jgi:peptidyl-tRNA hydrolase, PTH1 family
MLERGGERINIRVIVGLGNPGAQYARNRHNIGFLAIDDLARKLGATWQKKPLLELAEARVGAGKLWLVKPLTFMNSSGAAVAPLMRFQKIDPAQLLVIHDDLDLPFGRLRIRTGGSSGGQNGVKDITEKLGTDGFVRLKLGIDRPPAQWSVINWVLSNFQPSEAALLEGVLRVAVDAATAISRDGAASAQSQFNATDLRPKPPKPAVAPLETKTLEGVTESLETKPLEP